ncbi:MAG: hypothetical protein M0T71_02290 [Actinomycetota bacterium]|jgi:hypothetical protein|nr:hypothetical protein [Actinomycetota bacterium]
MTEPGRHHDTAADTAGDRPASGAPRRLAAWAGALWRQQPGPRAERPVVVDKTEKQIVDGLDVWELRFSVAATVVEGALTPLFYWYFRTHGSLAVRHAASEFLITGIITTVVLLLGTVLKRRALVGFAAFMTGMAWLTYGSLYFSVLFLVFGGWLILRVMRKQKQDRAAGKPATGAFGGPRRTAAPKAPAVPKASKRYTPPKRATTKGRASTGPRR